MASPDNRDRAHNITDILVAVVVLAIVIITFLTITAIWNGPPI